MVGPLIRSSLFLQFSSFSFATDLLCVQYSVYNYGTIFFSLFGWGIPRRRRRKTYMVPYDIKKNVCVCFFFSYKELDLNANCACIDKIISEENTQRNLYTIHSHTGCDLNNSMWMVIDGSLKFGMFHNTDENSNGIILRMTSNITTKRNDDRSNYYPHVVAYILYIYTNFNAMMARILDPFDFNSLWEHSFPKWICNLSNSSRFNLTTKNSTKKK